MRDPLEKIDPAVYVSLYMSANFTFSYLDDPPTAMIPSPPFSWGSVPAFSLQDESRLARQVVEQSHSVPQKAYVWSDAIRSEILNASNTVEAVSLVSLTRELGRLRARAQFMSVILVEECIGGSSFPALDLDTLFSTGEIRSTGSDRGGSAFCSVPEDYFQFLPPAFRTHPWDDVYQRPVVDSEGICYMVLWNEDLEKSKKRQSEIHGMQALVRAVWEEGRVDLFELPIACFTQYMCFRVIASPLDLWVRGEPSFEPFLNYSITSDPETLASWETSNSEVAAALREIALHLPSQIGKYPVGSHGALWLSVNRQKLVMFCPVELGMIEDGTVPEEDAIATVTFKISNFDCLVTSPVALRALLRENGIKIRYLGLILVRIRIPAIKRLLVREMLSRAAKWLTRRSLADALRNRERIPDIDLNTIYSDQEKELIASACQYFKVSPPEIEPYLPSTLDSITVRYFDQVDFSTVDNRVLFPHAALLDQNLRGHFPVSRFVGPRPVPSIPDPQISTPLDTLPLRYAAKIFQLELLMASGDVLDAVVCIGDLVDTIVRMRELEPLQRNKDEMRLKILALCEAARSLSPASLSVPATITNSIIQVTQSIKVYRGLRKEIVESEGIDSVSLLSIDSTMASQIYVSDPELAVTILSLVLQRAEKDLGVRNPVTVSSYIRKAQAIKRAIEASSSLQDVKKQQAMIQDGVRCLNKAIGAVTVDESLVHSSLDVIDQVALAYHLLAVLYMWNGEPARAVRVSRDGVKRCERMFGIYHPRYLNAAFLHAKLLENYAASLIGNPVEAVCVAREAAAILENLLSSLEELSIKIDESDEPDFEVDVKRKLAITALLLKLNVWLLDPALSSDLLDLVVSDKLSGARGVLLLPTRATVKEFVAKILQDRLKSMNQLDTTSLPILDLTSSLPTSIVACCHMALVAKSKGLPVSEWFKAFCDDTLRMFGDPKGETNRDLLNSLFLEFVFVSSQGRGAYVGPLSMPIVPRKTLPDPPTSHGVIYREWELSATLYCLDHGLYRLPSAVGSPLISHRTEPAASEPI